MPGIAKCFWMYQSRYFRFGSGHVGRAQPAASPLLRLPGAPVTCKTHQPVSCLLHAHAASLHRSSPRIRIACTSADSLPGPSWAFQIHLAHSWLWPLPAKCLANEKPTDQCQKNDGLL